MSADGWASPTGERSVTVGATLLTRDPSMLRVLEIATRVGSSPEPVLIHGESGTGKARLARFIHEQGVRREGRLVEVHCAAFAAERLGSALFGHEQGAAPGALAGRIGAFEAARGGTLVLGEIGELDRALQERLRCTLETGEIRRAGEGNPMAVDVRIVATTTRCLPALVDAGRFDADLLARLGTVSVRMPPLRERPADVALLADRFLERLTGLEGLHLDDAARELLASRPWPGNVRELEHTLERAAVFARGGTITAADLEDGGAGPPRLSFGSLAGLTVREMERRLIVETLARTRNNRTQAAKLLGISIRTLRNKLAEYRARGELPLAREPGF